MKEGRKEGGGGTGLITRTPYLGYGEKITILQKCIVEHFELGDGFETLWDGPGPLGSIERSLIKYHEQNYLVSY